MLKMVFCYQNYSGPTVRKNCSSDREKLLGSLEQSIQAVQGQNNFW